MMSEPASSGPVHHQNSGQDSPGTARTSTGPHIEASSTPVSSVTKGQRTSLRRTPLGIRRTFTKGFKSPVLSPYCSQSPKESVENLHVEISALKQKENALDTEIAQLEAEGYSMAELEQHISLLHEYNELKDTGQLLLGRLAVLRGVTTKDLYAEFGLDLED
ncbi:DNA repair protein SWI5 homolog [Pelobates fuscus]|uniref:DNA repair protein SWI5 homolog n=1 Tax=Pelobates fuscus TaxID=191477 RepID=UPI002FE4965A